MEAGRSFIASAILHAVRLATKEGLGVDKATRARREERRLAEGDLDRLLRCEATAATAAAS
jgi:hypothetical protein